MEQSGLIDVIVWDFDGVLNRNFVNGQYIWHAGFEDEFGWPIETFKEIVFRGDFHAVQTGELSLMELVTDWAREVGYQGDLRNVLEYWFQNDYDFDDRMMGWLDQSKRSPIRNVMGTNNEIMRTQFIAEDLGFSARMDEIYASGTLGVAKPDADFYEAIAEDLGADPERMLMIDDTAENVEGAQNCGWHGFHFTGKNYDKLHALLQEVGALSPAI